MAEAAQAALAAAAAALGALSRAELETALKRAAMPPPAVRRV